MGLLVADHLQPVLDPAQEQIGTDEILGRLCLDPAASRQFSESLDGAARSKLRVPPSGDELLGLREELAVADAAAPELDVVAGNRDRAVPLMGIHAPLHGVDIGDRGKVEIFAPDERLELAEEVLARFDVAGNYARLDEGGAL